MNHLLRRQLLATFVPAGLLLFGLAILSLGYGKDIGLLLREPSATAGLHPLTGLVSNLGVLLWAASASVCFFAGSLVRRADQATAAGFMFFSGCLSAYLCLDDFFQIHEDLANRYFGIRERYVYLVLGMAVFVYLFRYRHLILRTHYSVLIISFMCLGASVVIDDIFEPFMQGLGQGRILIEDGTKWLGIAAWCSYQVRTAYGLVAGERADLKRRAS